MRAGDPRDEVSQTVQRAASLLGLAGLARADGVLGIASGSALPGVPNVIPDLSVLPDLPGVPPAPRVSKMLPKVPKVGVVPGGITDSVGDVVSGVQPRQAPAKRGASGQAGGVGGADLARHHRARREPPRRRAPQLIFFPAVPHRIRPAPKGGRAVHI